MNRAFALLLLNVALTGWSVSAEPPEPAPPRQPRLGPVTGALGANHDRVIDASEIAGVGTAVKTPDENNDGHLAESEHLPFAPPLRRGPRQWPPPRAKNGAGWTPSPQGGLGNFGVVDSHLLRGAQPSATGIQSLKAMGVSTIVDLIPSEDLWQAEKAQASSNGITYTNMPMKSFGRPALDQVNAVLSIITNAPGKVFVHCKAGRDRTGTIVACYRIAQSGWTSDQALREANEFAMARTQIEMKEFVAEFAKVRTSLGN